MNFRIWICQILIEGIGLLIITLKCKFLHEKLLFLGKEAAICQKSKFWLFLRTLPLSSIVIIFFFFGFRVWDNFKQKLFLNARHLFSKVLLEIGYVVNKIQKCFTINYGLLKSLKCCKYTDFLFIYEIQCLFKENSQKSMFFLTCKCTRI